ncbi:molecular chaperone [Sodalis endosymbiont of Spalangia cameroni]|uniref:molecular chaperone n=1 Tax=Sodalis praecaptivus TaxID=1239307 RepID=UPI0031F8140F
MAINKKDLFNRLTEVSKNAPLQESSDGEIKKKKTHTQEKPTATSPTVKKTKIRRKPKNLQIPEYLWEAYEWLKENNTTSLLMTPYIIEGFREKLAKDGAFDRKKETKK